MKVSRGIGRAVGWLVAAWLALAGASAGAAEGAAGGAALTDFQGKPQPIEEFIGQGRWTVVMFWASDCRVCAQEAPAWVLFDERQVARFFTERARQPWLGTPSFLVYAPTGELKARHVGALPPERLEEYIRKQASK